MLIDEVANSAFPPPCLEPKTRPWRDDEYMEIDGLKVVYTVDETTGSLLVRMPGGVAATVQELVSQGRTVRMPGMLREF
jgi:hypothetical protein